MQKEVVSNTQFTGVAAEPEVTSRVVSIGPFPDWDHLGLSTLVPGKRMLLVPSQDTDTVSLVNVDTREIIRTIQLPGGGMPWHAKATPDGRFGYVTNSRFNGHVDTSPRENSTVSVVDLDNQTYVKDIPVLMGPAMIEMDPVRPRAYVTNMRSNRLVSIDTRTHEVVDSVETGFQPMWVRSTHAGDVLLVCNFGDATLSLMDPNTLKVINTVHVGIPRLTMPFPEFGVGDTIGIAVTSSGIAYVCNWRSSVITKLDVYGALKHGSQAILGCEHVVQYPFSMEIDEQLGVFIVGSYNLQDSQIVVLDFDKENPATIGPKLAGLPIDGSITPTGKAAEMTYWFSQPFENRIMGFVTQYEEEERLPDIMAVAVVL
jgi:YVTN family beta-propeller protein